MISYFLLSSFSFLLILLIFLPCYSFKINLITFNTLFSFSRFQVLQRKIGAFV